MQDSHLELYIDNSNILTTVVTEIKPMYDQASIIIVDNDSELI